jgi:chromate transporter
MGEQHFLDLLGATNLIPGPNSTEMVIHVGRVRAGWPGLVVAGILFILPAASIVLALAWAYVRYGATPTATWLLYGIKPVIIAVVAQALWSLGKSAVKGLFLALVGLAVFGLYLLGLDELLLLFGGGLLVMVVENIGRLRREGGMPAGVIVPLLGFLAPGMAQVAGAVPLA